MIRFRNADALSITGITSEVTAPPIADRGHYGCSPGHATNTARIDVTPIASPPTIAKPNTATTIPTPSLGRGRGSNQPLPGLMAVHRVARRLTSYRG